MDLRKPESEIWVCGSPFDHLNLSTHSLETTHLELRLSSLMTILWHHSTLFLLLKVIGYPIGLPLTFGSFFYNQLFCLLGSSEPHLILTETSSIIPRGLRRHICRLRSPFNVVKLVSQLFNASKPNMTRVKIDFPHIAISNYRWHYSTNFFFFPKIFDIKIYN